MLEDGTAQWGRARAYAYFEDMRASFQYIADRHDALPRRTRLTGVSGLSLHRVGSHYVVFKLIAEGEVAITGILHQHMDVSTHLQALKSRADKELGDMRAMILRDMFKG